MVVIHLKMEILRIFKWSDQLLKSRVICSLTYKFIYIVILRSRYSIRLLTAGVFFLLTTPKKTILEITSCNMAEIASMIYGITRCLKLLGRIINPHQYILNRVLET